MVWYAPQRGYRLGMDIIRHDDGSLTVPVAPVRASDDADSDTDTDTDSPTVPEAATIVLRPGEGGYTEALAEWDLQQDPDRGERLGVAALTWPKHDRRDLWNGRRVLSLIHISEPTRPY